MKLQFTTRPKTQKIFIVNLVGKCNLTPNYMSNCNQVKAGRWDHRCIALTKCDEYDFVMF